jgi:hypothetical protein
VPSQSNSKPIHKPIETTYLHTDSSGYGWGAVLNEQVGARGFWSKEDEQQHITWKELKAVRQGVEFSYHNWHAATSSFTKTTMQYVTI